MSIARVTQGFGRPPPARGPAMLGDAVDDLVQQIKDSEAWAQVKKDLADGVYNQVLTRFDADKVQLGDQITQVMTPKLEQAAKDAIQVLQPELERTASEALTTIAPQAQQEMYRIFDDAQTQARLGSTVTEIRNTFIPVAVGGVFATAILTWLLVRYAGGRGRS